MSLEIPLGKREDLHLEFKSVAALDRPEIIGREVAAMLNAEGGEVWIGLRDQDGRAVEIQPVSNPARACDALHDSLVDRLDPSPLPQEVCVEQVPLEGGGSLLRVVVRPVEDRKPYALLKSGGWHFQMRIGNRIRKMSREEIFRSSMKGAETKERLAAIVKRLLSEREEFQKSAGEQLWLRILPVDMELNLAAIPLRELLEDPSKTGNRYAGWHFAQTSSGIKVAMERRSWSYGLFEAELAADGGLGFSLPLRGLRWKTREREINPLLLLEYPISAFRLASRIYDPDLETAPETAAALALFGVHGWKLCRGPAIYGQFEDSTEPFTGERDLVSSRPLSFKYQEVMREPDRCGYRLVRRVSEAFGIRDRDMPKEFDSAAGRLVLPE